MRPASPDSRAPSSFAATPIFTDAAFIFSTPMLVDVAVVIAALPPRYRLPPPYCRAMLPKDIMIFTHEAYRMEESLSSMPCQEGRERARRTA